MPAGIILFFLCPLGLTSDAQDFFFVWVPAGIHSAITCYYAVQDTLLISLKAFYNECLHEVICFYALQDALLMSLKAFCFMNACRLFCCFLPFRSHSWFSERPTFDEWFRNSLVFMPFRTHFWCPYVKAFFNERLQAFMIFVCPPGVTHNVLKGPF